MKRVLVSRHAEQDLDSIWRYIAADVNNLETADDVVDVIVKQFALLARHPRARRKRDEIASGIRSFPSGNYLIYYRESHVVISRILHAKRDQAGARKKPKTT
jgi:toxin ParE1/3/4